MKLKHNSLFFRLTLLGATAALLSALALGSYIAFKQGKLVKLSALKEADLISTGLATAFSADIIVKNYAGVEQTVLQSRSYPYIARLLVTNSQGTVIAEIQRDANTDEWHLSHGKKISIPSDPQFVSRIEDNRIVAWAPILGGNLVGWVRLEMLLDHVAAIQTQIISDTMLLAAISVAISTLVVVWVLRRPIRQIHRASAFADRLPDDYGQILPQTSSVTELTHLVAALNSTSQKLYQQDQDLKMLKVLIEYSDDPVYILAPDEGFRLIFANNATCRHFGMSLNKLLTLRVQDWDTDKNLSDTTELWEQLKKIGYLTFTSHHRVHGDRIIPVEISANYIRFGEREFIAGYFRDIRERVNAQMELTRTKDLAVQSAKSKSEFLANMSHEIRTPMNGIIGLTQLALNQPMSEEARDCLNKIFSSSQSLMCILNDILELSRLEAGRVEIEQTAFDLHEILDNLLNLFQEPARCKNLEFSIQLAKNTCCSLIGDAMRIQQILSNLLGNAIKFTQSGFVKVSVTPELSALTHAKTTLIFTVCDSGIGIAAEDLPKLFKPFSQVDTSITRRFGGTGLGLAISKNLLECMGSTFNINSQLGQGTAISFSLELGIAAAEHGRSRTENIKFQPGDLTKLLKESGRPLQGKRVLVAEDNRINQKIICDFLRLSGLEATLTENGQQAVQKLEQQTFDAVLMDIHMPVMDGKEATAIIRSQPELADLPIIALTAGVTAEEIASYLAIGMNGVIAKPVNPDTLLAVLIKWIKPLAD